MKNRLRSILVLSFILFLSHQSFAAENSRSDTINILDYNIHLNVTDYAGKTISGFCEVSFQSKLDNITELDLDLKKLNIDSITQFGEQVFFTYADSETIRITLLAALNVGNSAAVIVYYHGKPKKDSGGWGGWYWSGDYSFNIGVALYDIPHTFGRVWFPCIDNFVERSTYHFTVTTPGDKMALCNGKLISSIENTDGTKTWNWQLLQPIPSYLASVAVNKYAPAYGSYISITGDTIPIVYGAIAADTTKMKNSFLHLPDALACFEQSWGPYQWNRVGYCETTVGAMEHATNIAYPNFIINGQTTYEGIMAHELSHQWFGNLVTCRTPEDMWLNEGWAEYCSYRFREWVYGKDDYRSAVASNHEATVHYAHTPIDDGDYYALNAVPQQHTYGTTVYYKGSDIVHTLRGYMGDSLFFQCVTNYLNEYSFNDASSEDLRDYLSDCSGIDLSYFFDDWVFAPGWAAFTIDSTHVVAGQPGEFYADVHIKQRLDHTTHFYSHVPLEISFYNEEGSAAVVTCYMSGSCGVYPAILPFNPVYVGLDLDEKISDAVTADLQTFSSIGTKILPYGKITLNISSISDSALIRAEHVYAAPDAFKNPVANLHISQERFWKADGIFPSQFEATAAFTYNGTTSTGGFLDNQLITNAEDSLVVLYRAFPSEDWQIVIDATHNFQGSHTDEKGIITVNHFQKGEYTFGIFQHDKQDSILNTGSDTCLLLSASILPAGGEGLLDVFPNPSAENLNVVLRNSAGNNLLEVYNLYGVRVYHSDFAGEKMISVKNWMKGIYLIKVSSKKNTREFTQLIVIN